MMHAFDAMLIAVFSPAVVVVVRRQVESRIQPVPAAQNTSVNALAIAVMSASMLLP